MKLTTTNQILNNFDTATIKVTQRGSSTVARQQLYVFTDKQAHVVTFELEARASYFTNKTIERFRVLDRPNGSDSFKALTATQFMSAFNVSSEVCDALMGKLKTFLPGREALVAYRQNMNVTKGLCPTPYELGFKQIGGYKRGDLEIHTFVAGKQMIHHAPSSDMYRVTSLGEEVKATPDFTVHNTMDLRKLMVNTNCVAATHRVSEYMAKLRRRNLKALGI